MELKYMTAGESHGPQLTAIITGYPSGVPILIEEDINKHLARRQQGHGRSVRQRIETDVALVKSGVRHGKSIGDPIAIVIENKDHKTWTKAMSVHPEDKTEIKQITKPRPGHADLAGCMKYDHTDARNILERSSARETAARVAVGAICNCLLRQFGVEIFSHVRNLGGVEADTSGMSWSEIREKAEQSSVRMANAGSEEQAVARIDEAQKAGDTLGGIIEVVALGAPMGLGTCMHWEDKLDGLLAQGICSIQAFKGVEIGAGFSMAGMRGSEVHDPILIDPQLERALEGHGPSGSFYHPRNNAGGLEGGMTTGEPIILRGIMKPIATLMKPLKSVDLNTLEPFDASRERSDVCALPAAGVVAEAVVAFILCREFLKKFGGDSLNELKRNYGSYVEYLKRRSTKSE